MKHFIILLCMSTMLSCSSSRLIKAEIAEGVNLSTNKTFDFYKLEAGGDTISSRFRERADILKTAIADELARKGYRQVSDNPDLLVNIGICVTEEVQTRQTDFRTDAPRYVGQRRYSWKSRELEVGRYRMGTVDIHLVDAKTNTIVWQKVAESVIPEKDSKLSKKTKDGIKKMFADFPVSGVR